MPAGPLTVREVEVRETVAYAVVDVRSDAVRTSALPGFADTLLRALPGLASHDCENASGASFAEELRDTETAHAFEHVTLQLMRLAGSSDIAGETRWDSRADGRGVFRVTIEFDDDLVALGAMRLAERVMASAAGEAAMPDLPEEIARLRRVSRRA